MKLRGILTEIMGIMIYLFTGTENAVKSDGGISCLFLCDSLRGIIKVTGFDSVSDVALLS